MASNHLQRAVDLLGSQSAFAAAIAAHAGKPLTQQAVSYWLNQGDGVVPAEWCPHVEAVTAGVVTRYQLRPDVFGVSAFAERAVAAAVVVPVDPR